MFSMILTSVSAYTNLDVSAKFIHYANGFCSGGVVNADIGNGNLAANFRRLSSDHMDAYDLGASHSKLSREEFMELGNKPGRSSNKTLGSCNEKSDTNTCVNSAGVYHWCNYSGYKCMTKYAGQYGDITYSNMAASGAVPEVYYITYNNAGKVDTTATVTSTQKSTNVQTISSTYGFNIGAELDISAGEPGIFSVSDKFTWSFDMHETDTASETTEQDFTWSGIVPEPAMSTTMVQLTIQKESYSGAWSGRIKLPYYSKIWCGSSTNGHHEWFIQADTFLGSGPYHAKGVFTGAAGLKMETTAKTCALYTTDFEKCEPEALFASTDLASSTYTKEAPSLVFE